MRYTIYKITNKINGKYYIGKHQTVNPMDDYMGSGRAIENAIKLHGKTSFVKEILFDFDTEEQMNQKERELITEDIVNDPLSYNLGVGGEGGAHFKGKKHTVESRSKMGRKGKVLTEQGREKIREVNIKRIISEETRRKISEKAKGRTHNTETKKKISESIRNKVGRAR